MSVLGLGTELWAGSTPAKVAKVMEIGDVGASRGTVDTSTYDTKGYREFLGTLREGGDVAITLAFDQVDAEQKKLADAFDADEVIPFEIRLPTANKDVIKFNAVITGLSQAVPLEDIIKRTVTLKPSGAITFDKVTP